MCFSFQCPFPDTPHWYSHSLTVLLSLWQPLAQVRISSTGPKARLLRRRVQTSGALQSVRTGLTSGGEAAGVAQEAALRGECAHQRESRMEAIFLWARWRPSLFGIGGHRYYSL